MGADFIGTYVAAPRYDDDNDVPETDDEIRQAITQLNERIDNLDDDTLLAVHRFSHGEEPEDDDWADAVRETLHRAVAFNGPIWKSRETAWWCVAGHWIVVTGGLSTGDTPTDAFDLLDPLGMSGVTDEVLVR